jgi:5'-3' exonuclease
MFWDAPRETVWRRHALKTYKDRSSSQYVEGIAEDLALLTSTATEILDHMNVRQYYKKQMEADDLIYALSSVLHPHPSIIVSTDSDMLQIPHSFSSCRVYDPTKREELDPTDINPAVQKALTGDKADSIEGYRGIGPKTSAAMLADLPRLYQFLEEKGASTYRRNLLLIDLSLCPRLLANKLYVQKKLAEPVNFDKEAILELAKQHKISGLLTDFVVLAHPFLQLS